MVDSRRRQRTLRSRYPALAAQRVRLALGHSAAIAGPAWPGHQYFCLRLSRLWKKPNLHPSEASTYEDADAAWRYLTDTRHVSPSSIVLDGVGLGAAIAAETARRHPQAPALILEDPAPPTLDSLQFDPRMHLLPIRLLFHDRFDPTKTLAQLRTPKLLLYSARDATGRYYDIAAEPKQRANVANAQDYVDSLRGFLGKYLPGA